MNPPPPVRGIASCLSSGHRKLQTHPNLMKLSLSLLALAILAAASPVLAAGSACKKCCGDACAACCKEKGKACGKDCCKAEK